MKITLALVAALVTVASAHADGPGKSARRVDPDKIRIGTTSWSDKFAHRDKRENPFHDQPMLERNELGINDAGNWGRHQIGEKLYEGVNAAEWGRHQIGEKLSEGINSVEWGRHQIGEKLSEGINAGEWGRHQIGEKLSEGINAGEWGRHQIGEILSEGINAAEWGRHQIGEILSEGINSAEWGRHQIGEKLHEGINSGGWGRHQIGDKLHEGINSGEWGRHQIGEKLHEGINAEGDSWGRHQIGEKLSEGINSAEWGRHQIGEKLSEGINAEGSWGRHQIGDVLEGLNIGHDIHQGIGDRLDEGEAHMENPPSSVDDDLEALRQALGWPEIHEYEEYPGFAKAKAEGRVQYSDLPDEASDTISKADTPFVPALDLGPAFCVHPAPGEALPEHMACEKTTNKQAEEDESAAAEWGELVGKNGVTKHTNYKVLEAGELKRGPSFFARLDRAMNENLTNTESIFVCYVLGLGLGSLLRCIFMTCLLISRASRGKKVAREIEGAGQSGAIKLDEEESVEETLPSYAERETARLVEKA